MISLPFLQDLIHKLEMGKGSRYFKVGLTALALMLLTVGYNWRAFRNMASQEAMDSAQLAHNIAEGRGYTTFFVRPLSIYLLKKHNKETGDAAYANDLGRLKEGHPDLANPPVYPTLLAGLMKVLPFRYSVSTIKPFWSSGGRFARYEPDFLIALFNQTLFLGAVVLTFFLARRLFDVQVAWLSAIIMLGSEIWWRFSVSGLSTMLLLLIFTTLLWCLVVIEQEGRDPKRKDILVLGLAAAAGALTGAGMLTRYSFGCLIVPVFAFMALYGGSRRVLLSLSMLAAFAVVVGPWVARNYAVSGTPLGTASYAVVENTFLFPEHRLERSLEPDIRFYMAVFWNKFLVNIRPILQVELPKVGGSWVTTFFLVGLLVAFRNPTTKRVRYFLVGSAVVLAIVQALCRTRLSDDLADINSENLLVLLGPLVIMYGVGLFYLVLETMALPFLELRYLVISLFGLIACLPMVFMFLPPAISPVVNPPYFPPLIKQLASWMKQDELIMSDIPWAVAWYGDRQSIWQTLKAMPDKDKTIHEDFFTINDLQKPIKALYLTPVTLDSRFQSAWVVPGAEDLNWGSFIVQCMVFREVPLGFPLRETLPSVWPYQLILADWRRWAVAQ
jgi:4-amino-4-deoxy-L-arabinose transferase-like glycosyltransferase